MELNSNAMASTKDKLNIEVECNKVFKKVGKFGAQVSFAEANHRQSMRLLERNGLKALTYGEALVLLMKDEVLKNALKGKWFWLAGNGIDREEVFTVDGTGEIVKGKEKDKEKLVRAWSGDNQPYLMVLSDEFAAYVGRRFGVGGYDAWPGDVAPLVVGIRK